MSGYYESEKQVKSITVLLMSILTTMLVAFSGNVCGSGCEGECKDNEHKVNYCQLNTLFSINMFVQFTFSQCYLTIGKRDLYTTRHIGCVGKLYT